MAHLPPNYPFGGKRAYEAFKGLSWGFLRRANQSSLGLSSVRGNSRAPVLGVIRGSQTRLCKAYAFARRICRVLLFVCELGAERRQQWRISEGYSLLDSIGLKCIHTSKRFFWGIGIGLFLDREFVR